MNLWTKLIFKQRSPCLLCTPTVSILTSTILAVLFVSPSKNALDKFYVYCPPLLLNEIYALGSTWYMFKNEGTDPLRILARLNAVITPLIYNPKSEKVGTVWKTQIKKVVISKFTLTCISLQTIWTQNISCFVWSTSCHLQIYILSCHSDLQHIPKKSWDSKAFTTL